MDHARFIGLRAIAIASLAAGLAGCQGIPVNADSIGAATKGMAAMSLTDAQVKEQAKAGVAAMDHNAKLASAGSKYQKRLNKLTKSLRSVNGQALNYKVYMTKDVNAFATADGSIRVSSGLMDMMDDDELTFIIGHEMGHVAAGHSAQRMRTAALAGAGREVAASAGGRTGAIASSQLGGFIEKVVNAQFSQSNERQADDYGLETLKKAGRNPNGAVTALEKLASGSSGGSSTVAQMVSTHPEPGARAERMRKAIQSGK